jgi:hypothetical protein
MSQYLQCSWTSLSKDGRAHYFQSFSPVSIFVVPTVATDVGGGGGGGLECIEYGSIYGRF